MPHILPSLPITDEMTWRPPVREDAAGIAILQDACFESDGGYREVESEILQRWELDTCNVETDALVAVDEQGAVVASVWSLVPTTATSKWRAFNENYVHPEYRSDEIRSFVLGWWEARGRQRFAEHNDDLDRWLCHHVYDWQSDKIALLDSHGYQPVRYFDELIRDLSVLIDDSALADGLQVRSLESAPLEHTRLVSNEAFADHWGSQPFSESAWSRIDNEFLIRKASFVVYDDETPVSFLLATSYPHDFKDRGHSEAWIDALGTLRSHRKQGIASALVTLAMRQFASDGMEYAVLGVDSENPTGAYGLYESLGFGPDRRSIAYNKQIFDAGGEQAHG